MAKKAKSATKSAPANGYHQAGLELWNKALKGKKYDSMPRGFRAEFVAKMCAALGCKESSAQTYVQHYARHGSAKWDYQAATAPRYAALKTGKARKAKNGSKVKYVKPARAAAKAAPARARKANGGARAAA